MTVFEIAMMTGGAVMAVAIAMLVVVNRQLLERLDTLNKTNTELAEKFAALREQNQQELLAIGQRVLEADKLVRRFSERLDAIENNAGADLPQYGQLQNLLKQTNQQSGEASAAEKELLTLLTRQRKLSS